MHIIIIEDDYILSKSIAKFCELKKYTYYQYFDGEDAYDGISLNTVCDLFIVDINLPNMSGLEIVKKIRSLHTNIPIVIITASLESHPLEVAFSLGCNEYIKKPFYLVELDIRIQKILSSRLKVFNITEELEFDFDSKALYYKTQEIELRKKERRALDILIKNFNFVVSNEVLEDYVWEGEIKDSYPLRQLMNTIRSKIPVNFIKTEIGIGYKATNEAV